ncbi:MAG: hypothetical protein AABX31_05980, partial [Nanoarchaeota archaeon]
MEIPLIRLELYQQDSELFSRQLGQALETIGVAQVDGFKQHLVDELYLSSEEPFGRIVCTDLAYLNYGSTKIQIQSFPLPSTSTDNPIFDSLVKDIKTNLGEIHRKVAGGMSAYKKDFHFLPFSHFP